jgi:hypothetical protein
MLSCTVTLLLPTVLPLHVRGCTSRAAHWLDTLCATRGRSRELTCSAWFAVKVAVQGCVARWNMCATQRCVSSYWSQHTTRPGSAQSLTSTAQSVGTVYKIAHQISIRGTLHSCLECCCCRQRAYCSLVRNFLKVVILGKTSSSQSCIPECLTALQRASRGPSAVPSSPASSSEALLGLETLLAC